MGVWVYMCGSGWVISKKILGRGILEILSLLGNLGTPRGLVFFPSFSFVWCVCTCVSGEGDYKESQVFGFFFNLLCCVFYIHKKVVFVDGRGSSW